MTIGLFLSVRILRVKGVLGDFYDSSHIMYQQEHLYGTCCVA